MEPLLSGHLRDLPVIKIAQCLLMINIQQFLCTVKKFHVVKEAIKEAVQYFVQDL